MTLKREKGGERGKTIGIALLKCYVIIFYFLSYYESDSPFFMLVISLFSSTKLLSLIPVFSLFY